MEKWTEEGLVQALEKANVTDYNSIIKYVWRLLYEEKGPYLPGLLPNNQFKENMVMGDVITGIVGKDRLSNRDKGFYNKMDDVEILQQIWERGANAYVTSSLKIADAHEKKFTETVGKELLDRINKYGHVDLIDLGIGPGEEIDPRLINYLQNNSDDPDVLNKITVYGIEAFKKMLKKSMHLKSKLDYNPIRCDIRKLPIKKTNGVFISGSGTSGNFKRSDRKRLYSLIGESMSHDAVFYDSVYFEPEDSKREEWSLALRYRMFERDVLLAVTGFRLVTEIEGIVADHSDSYRLPSDILKKNYGVPMILDIHGPLGLKTDEEKIDFEKHLQKELRVNFMSIREFVKNPHFLFIIYNEFTHNVEAFTYRWDNGKFKPECIIRSHRFSEEELGEMARRANLDMKLQKDEKENMFVVKLTKE